jgi:hypothetical protein
VTHMMRRRTGPDAPLVRGLRSGQLWLGGDNATGAPTEPETSTVGQQVVPARRIQALVGLVAIGTMTFVAIVLLVWFLWNFQPINWGG